MKVTHLFFWLMIVAAIILAGLGIALGWRQLAASGRAHKLFAGAVQGSGKIETVTRAPGEFDSIAIAYPGTIIIQQGEENLVTVEADDNLIPQLATDVRDGALAIENSEDNYFKRVAPTKSVKITITVTDLKEITLVEPARVEVNNLKTDTLTLTLQGVGDIVLKYLTADSLNVHLYGGKVTAGGMTKNVSISIGKSGEFDGADLKALDVNIQIGGTASATVRVSDSLSVSLSGTATVNYYGSPETIRESISGTASINKLGD